MTNHAEDGTPTLSLPNFEPLRQAGWSIKTVTGAYCVAWRGADEVVFAWRDGEWQRVTTRTLSRAA